MKNEIIIRGALANCGKETSTEELIDFLKPQAKGVVFYRLVPPPGVHMNAAFDWQAVLGVTASAIAIGQLLWAGYVKYIRPQQEKGKEDAFLYVSIQDGENDHVQFAAGREYKDKEEFVREFSVKTETIRISKNGDIEGKRSEIKYSNHWKKQ